jgi:hypothetical protein
MLSDVSPQKLKYQAKHVRPNGKRIAAGSLDGIDRKITIYDIARPEEVETELLAEEKGLSWICSDIAE